MYSLSLHLTCSFPYPTPTWPASLVPPVLDRCRILASSSSDHHPLPLTPCHPLSLSPSFARSPSHSHPPTPCVDTRECPSHPRHTTLHKTPHNPSRAQGKSINIGSSPARPVSISLSGSLPLSFPILLPPSDSHPPTPSPSGDPKEGPPLPRPRTMQRTLQNLPNAQGLPLHIL